MLGFIVAHSPFGLNAANLLIHLDPFNSNTITFSSCVTVLSQVVTDPSSKSTLLFDLAELQYN